MIAREWAGQIEPEILTRLERFTYLSQVTLGARTSKPFLVHGVTARELHAEHRTEHAADEQAGSGAVQRRAIGQTLKLVEAHDERIKDWLEQHPPVRERQHAERSHSAPSGGTRVVQTGGTKGTAGRSR
jgi:hypothetical protein